MDDLLLRTAKLLRTQVAAFPENLELKLHLAEVLAQLGETTAVAELIDPALLSFLSDKEESFENLLRSIGTSNPEVALNWVDQAIAENKSNARLYWRRSELLEALGRHEDAEKYRGVACVINESYETQPPQALFALTAPKAATSTDSDASEEKPEPKPITHYGAFEDDTKPEDIAEVDEFLASLEGGPRKANFADVGGMEVLKNQVRMKILLPFQQPEVFKKFKKKAGGGVLLYGPPGCGKTLLARAAAGEANLFFGNLGIPEVLSKWMGESEQRIHSFFETARRKAPSLLFIDEIDALGGKRSEASSSMSTLVNVLLTEIDGASSNNENVFVLAATNMPWRVDSAFRRPGRFDQVIFVPPPDLEARKAILELYLKDLPVGKIDIAKIAKVTNKYSGADIESLVSAAAEDALMEEMNSGKSQLITTERLIKRSKLQRATTLEWLEQATNYASFANNSGLYDDLAKYLDEN